MVRRALAVLVVLLLLAALLGAVGGVGRKPLTALAAPSQTVVAAVGQAGEVRCPAGQLTVQFATGPLRWQCGPKGSTTTTSTSLAPSTITTVVPTSTTVVLPTTTSTTAAPSSAATPAADMPDSLFNQPATSSVLPGSATMVADLVAASKQYNVGVNTAPIYAVPAGTAEVPLSVTSGCNNFLASTGNEIPLPSFVALNGSSDNPLILYSTSLNKVWELWQAKTSGGGVAACWGGSAPLSTFSGTFPAPYGLSASGISYLATTITEADVASGSIDHAIAFEIDGCYAPGSPGQAAAPADREDCDTQANSKPGEADEGTWLRFPASLAMPAGLTPFGQMVFRAVQTYGMVVVDWAGAVMLEAEQPSDWAAQGNTGTDPITKSWGGEAEYSVVANLPWSDLQAVNPPQ